MIFGWILVRLFFLVLGWLLSGVDVWFSIRLVMLWVVIGLVCGVCGLLGVFGF